MKVFLLIAIMSLSTALLAQTQVLTAEPINVDGVVTEAPEKDPELVQIQAEIKKQKETIVLNKAKAKQFQELSKSVEKLSETTEEYLEEKRAAQQEIAEYNAKVKCLQAETPGPECDKYVRRR